MGVSAATMSVCLFYYSSTILLSSSLSVSGCTLMIAQFIEISVSYWGVLYLEGDHEKLNSAAQDGS